MRALCKVGCTTPYHRTLRNRIGAVIEQGKTRYPNNFIQVKIDVENFALKVSRRRIDTGVWYNNVDIIPLDESVLDLSRIGPKPPPSGDRDMEIEAADGEGLQG